MSGFMRVICDRVVKRKSLAETRLSIASRLLYEGILDKLAYIYIQFITCSPFFQQVASLNESFYGVNYHV